jgi:hypothetical protein
MSSIVSSRRRSAAPGSARWKTSAIAQPTWLAFGATEIARDRGTAGSTAPGIRA